MAEIVVENFFGVYILLSKNPRYKGRTYIGFTVNPNRRIQQHNKGKHAGGAWRTSNRGPWEMILIVHGFLEEVSALRFEWAWQHPERSRRLQHLPKKKSSENRFQYNFRILAHMLNTGPWNKLPLTVQWLKPEYSLDFHPSLQPPNHMPIEYGQVLAKKIPQQLEDVNLTSGDDTTSCALCKKTVHSGKLLRCLNAECSMKSHILCLADHFLKTSPDSVLPVEGVCPECSACLLWGDVVRKKKGCYGTKEVFVNNILID